MRSLIAPVIAAFVLALAAPALAGGGCGGYSTQSVDADSHISTPVDTASTEKPDTAG